MKSTRGVQRSGTMRRSGRRRAVAGLVGLTLVAAACGGNDDGGAATPGGAATAPPEESTETTPAPDDGAPGESDGGAVETDISAAPSDTTAPDGTAGDGAGGEPESEGSPVSNEGEPQQGGTLRYGLEADVDGINPTSSALSAPGLMMANAVFDTLTAPTTDGSFVPYLAETVEPNEDFTQWTVTLREGVTFHDGTPLDADAVIVNFEAQRADPLVGLAVRPFYPEEGAVAAVDDLTVQFNLLEGNRYFPGSLASQLGYVASPTWIAAAVEDPTLNQAPVGTGPFVFENRSEDSVTSFTRNDEWWNGEVLLDRLEFLPVTDPANRNDLLLNGELDALQSSDPESVDVLLDEGSVQSVFDESGEETFVMINSEAPPFDDIRARQALTLATPLQNFRTLIGLGTASPADQMFTEDSRYHDPEIVQEGDDVAAAQALVDEYCAELGGGSNPVLGTPNCTDGKINMEFQFSGPSTINTRAADLFREGWSSLFNITNDELQQDAHIQEAALGQYNTTYWRQFGAEDPSLDNVWLLCRTVGGISLNWPRLCDEERDALLLEGQLAEPGPDRDAIYQQVSQTMHDAYTYIFLVHTPWDNAFAENVRGVCDRRSPEGEQLICSTNGRTWFDTTWLA
ncbi:ABC transporter substrate-binding protein [Ilumatobacter sp.]|uniref:ABC transporter substrate-binding protein n=1 Tax=Ilumatobacter sp. TaxID=1967498 RepID=UPI003B52E3C9